jgi:hypothetical protein
VLLFGCCICFVKVFQVFLSVFASVSNACFKCFIFFRRMLQNLHLNVLKIDRMLYMLQCDSHTIAACCSCWGTMHACGKWGDRALCDCGRGKWRGRAAAVGIRPDASTALSKMCTYFGMEVLANRMWLRQTGKVMFAGLLMWEFNQ